MALHHRHKQRILTSIVTLIIFVIALDVAIVLGQFLDLATTLLYAFAVAIGLTTAYQCYNYRHSHEHITLVNTLTQIFMGTILFASAILMLLLQAFFAIEVADSYLYLSIIVVILTFIFLKRFDRFLESEVQGRFPMGTPPAPRTVVVVQRPAQRPAAQAKRKENPVKKMTFKHKGR